MGRLIIIILSAVAVFYFFGGKVPGSAPPGMGGTTTGPAPPSRMATPKQTAQIEVQPAALSQTKPGFRTFYYKLALPGQQQPQTITFDIPDEIIATAGSEMPLYNSADVRKVLDQDAPRITREVKDEKARRMQQVVNIINRDIMMKNGVTMSVKETAGRIETHYQYWATHQNKQTLSYLQDNAKTMFEAYAPYRNLFERQDFIARQTQFLSQYIPYNYYAYDLDYDRSKRDYVGYLRPDFMQLARVQRENLYSLAQELFKATPVKEPRNLAAMALYFVQAIPIAPDDTQRNLVMRKIPFASPTAVLVNNRGSADSKATMLASLLGILLPDYTVVMYLLPEHAVIGINLPPQPNDFTHRNAAGGEFVLMEPFGPNLQPIGQVVEYTQQVIDKGLYSYFAVPQ